MNLEHVAIWTDRLEELKLYYVKYFGGQANAKYFNGKNNFESYFISFDSGARLEIMSKPGIPDNTNDRVVQQHKGIIHLAFGVATMKAVDDKAIELAQAGYKILRGPRKTGDGYYEFETLDPDDNRLEVTSKYLEGWSGKNNKITY